MYRAGAAYRADIDGLRAISIIAVVAFHAFPALVPGGFVGVDVFFVISGYLISTIIFTGLKGGTFSFADFYARRARRIFPGLLLVLFAVWLLGWRQFIPSDFERLGRDIAAGASYLSNIFFWSETGYFDKTAAEKPLLHLWSLAVEEQFYIIFPLTAFVAWKKRWNLLLVISEIGILSFVSNVAVVSHHPAAAFYLPQARFWELMIGSSLAYAGLFFKAAFSILSGRTFRNSSAMLGVLLLLAGIFGLSPKLHYPGWWALIPTAGATFLIFSGRDAWINRTILSNRVCVFVGLISYPLYLWHWPILSFARMMVDHDLDSGILIALVALAFLLAWLTYEFVEKPIRFGSPGIASGASAALLAAIVLLAVTPLGLYTYATGGLPARFPAVLQWSRVNDDETLIAYRQQECFLPIDSDAWVFADRCVDEEVRDEPLIFLWGDLHAADLYPGLRRGQIRYGFRLAQFTSSSCPPVLNIDFSFEFAPLCRQRNDDVFSRIAILKPDWVILSAQWQMLAGDWSKLTDTIVALKGMGISKILLVGPTPVWPSELPHSLQQYYVKHRIVPSRMREGVRLFSHVDTGLREIAKVAGVSYISPLDLMCNDEGCVTRVGDGAEDIVAWDADHLTVAGSNYLVERFPPVLFEIPRLSDLPAASNPR